MFAQHFATYRIAWSRALVIALILFALFAPPAALHPGWLAELSEMLGFFLLAAATLWRIWCALFIAGSKNGTTPELVPLNGCVATPGLATTSYEVNLIPTSAGSDLYVGDVADKCLR